MAEILNNSNDDSFERNILEIGMFESGLVDSQIRGDPCKPVAMINEFSPIDELEEGEILGDPVFNSTMISDPVSTVTVPEPSPVEQFNNSYQLNPEELVTRLNDTQPAPVPVFSHDTITVRDPGSGIPIHPGACECTETDNGPCVSWDGFAGNLKILTQTVVLNKGILSANKKKLQQLQEKIFQQQLKYEKVEDSNKEVTASNTKLAQTLTTLAQQLQDHKKTISTMTLKHSNLLEDHENCKKMLDEAHKFEICAQGGAAQITASLKQAYENQLAYAKLQKKEMNDLTQRINKYTNERKSFLKLAEGRIQQFNSVSESGIDRLVRAHERSINMGQRRQTEIDEVEAELEEAYEEQDKLLETLGCEPEEVEEMDSLEYRDNMSKLHDTSRALQAKVRDLATLNRTLLEQHLNLSAVAGTKTRTTSTVGLPNRRPGALRQFKARNVSFSGFDATKPRVSSTLNKTC